MLDAPKGLRLHIGLLGRRNVGKSSLLNALAAQSVSIVSDTPGTTTDPVEKTLEFAPLGPVVFLDTAGLDDEGELGTQRTERTLAILPRTDMALVVTAENVWGHYEETIVSRLRKQAIPFLVVMNKTESSVASKDRLPDAMRGLPMVRASAKTGEGLETIRRELVRLSPGESLHEAQLVADLLPEKGVVILVVPIDSGAPKGRLILPQVQTIRDALDGRKLCLGDGRRTRGGLRLPEGTAGSGGLRFAGGAPRGAGDAAVRPFDDLLDPDGPPQGRSAAPRRRGRRHWEPQARRQRTHDGGLFPPPATGRHGADQDSPPAPAVCGRRAAL